MVIRTVKTNPREAEEIMQLHKGFFFRSSKDAIKVNDIIQFNVIKQNKPVLHRIETKLFVVTSVDDCMTAPVAKGFKLIGIRMM